MNSKQQWVDLENQTAELEERLYRQWIGLDVGPEEIGENAQVISTLAEAMVPSFRHDPDAWSLLSGIISRATLAPIELEIDKLSEQYLTFDDILLNGRPVTPYSALQYLYGQDDPQKRHELLSRVVQGHPAVDQAWERRRAIQSELSAEWDYTPLDDFLLAEGLDEAHLRQLLVKMGSTMRPTFEGRFAENRSAVLDGMYGEAWEDFLTLFMNRASEYVDQQMPTVDGLAAVRQVTAGMGFSIEKIAIDLEDRPRKEPVASAWPLRIPGDVRISVKPVDGAADLSALYHEMGHALHFTSIRPDLPYPLRAGYSHGVAETFAVWLQSLLSDPGYLLELGFSENIGNQFLHLEQLGKATAATLGCADSLCIVDYWTEGPLTHAQLGERFSQYAQQFMGISFPSQYLSNPVRMLDFNAVGFPVAHARVGHLLQQLDGVRRDWWHVAAAGEVLRSYMRGGRKAGFPTSMLHVDPFLERYAVG
jgi:hypothetical protein